MNGWTVRDEYRPDGENSSFIGNKFLTGNGRIGYRGTLAEWDKEEKTASIINGLYDRSGDQWREPVNGPNVLHCRFSWEGRDLDALSDNLLDHSQSLYMNEGLYGRDSRFALRGGGELSLSCRRFASMDNPDLLCQEIRIITTCGGKLGIRAGILGDVWDINGPHLKGFDGSAEGSLLSLNCLTGEKGIPLAAAVISVFPDEAVRKAAVVNRGRDVLLQGQLKVEAGREYTVVMYGSLSAGSSDAVETAREAYVKGFDELLDNHTSRWKELWDLFDVTIEGDERAQTALRFSLYHLLSIAPHHDEALSIAARGLSGQVYKGAVFWDTEMFMLPLFARVKPELAAPLIRYRIDSLAGAMEKAGEYGYKGAFYPWESQEGGYDACTLFNVNNILTGRPVRTFFRDKQIHISADIAVAFYDYIEWTGDGSLLAEGGAKMILQCCRFLYSRSYYRPDRDCYVLTDVTGPDEYHEQVDNNFYTNLMSVKALDALFASLDLLRRENSPFYEDFINGETDGEELEQLKIFRGKLFLPEPDGNGLIPQFDGWFSLEDIPLEDLLSRKQHKQEYLGGGEGLARWTTILKQADVILALSLYGKDYGRDVIEKNFRWYEPRTEHGSSLSACAYGIAAARTGRWEKACEYFIRTAEIDMHRGARQYVGDLYIGGTHPAANGGAWLTLMRGVLGLDSGPGSLSFDPDLPPHWKEVSFSLHMRGWNLSVRCTAEELTVTPFSTGEHSPVPELTVRGKAYKISPDGATHINYKEQ